MILGGRRARMSVLAGLLAAGTLAPSACGRSGATPGSTAGTVRQERYAAVVFLSGSEFFNWSYAGMRDAAKMLGPHVQVELQGPAEWDASLEARTVEQLTARKIDGLAVTAAEANALIPAIDKAVGAGIPVITFDSD